MQEKLAELREKYEELSLREQVLLVVALLVALGIGWYMLFSEPMHLQTKKNSTELKSAELAVAKLKQQHQSLLARRASDPHRDLKDRIVLLDKQIQKVNKQLAEKFHGLIEPRQMAQVLESVLHKNKDLKLLSVRSLASEPLLQPQVNEEAGEVRQVRDEQEQARVDIFRHGLQIEFEGNYLATLNYLKTLQALDWEFYWDAVALEVTDYPTSRVVITVHTLSLRDSWIGV